jgi:hypothetical protein
MTDSWLVETETIILNSDQNINVNQPNDDKEAPELVRIPSEQESEVPLFLRDSSDGQKGDDQDEKDKTKE